MTLFAGMSGWAYPEWCGPFYPPKTPASRMLAIYGETFNTVEVNNTFYRLPTPEAVAVWCEQVPAGFRFAFKAHRAITHRKRFAETQDIFERFVELLGGVGSRLGPVLFQFDTIADVPQLGDFLNMTKGRFPRVVVEFRHRSWFCDAAFDVLRAHDVALCATETDEGCDPLLSATAFSYQRWRKSSYAAGDLQQRFDQLEALAAGEHDVYVYLKHEVQNAVLLRDCLPPNSAQSFA